MYRDPRRQRRGIGQSVTVPPPVGGLNARDALAAMPPEDAVSLENWDTKADRLTVRMGLTDYATDIGAGDVEMLAEWRGATGSKLLAAGDGEVYDVSSSGSATAKTSASYTSDQWQTFHFNGQIFAFNGADAPWDYDGSAVAATSWSGSGLTIANLIGGFPFKQRVWLIETDSAVAWYGATNAITGTLTSFDLGQIVTQGGYLVAGGGWTRDGGDGMDDLGVFVFSSGEILVYQGTDPSSATTWSKVGSFFAAPPIGRRCVERVGGDLVVLTRQGIMPVSLIMQGWTVDQINQKTPWGKIAPLIKTAFDNYGSLAGWQLFRHEEKLYLNVPVVVGSAYEQYVCNLQTGAWTLYTGMNARCLGSLDGDVYVGHGSGLVYKHAGTSDDGTSISYAAKQAFNYLGNRNATKRWTALRPHIGADGTITAGIGVDVDFSSRNIPSGTISYVGQTSGSSWDEDDWDDATWSGDDVQILSKWVSVAGQGRAAAIRFEGVAANQTLDWYATDFLIQPGGVL